MGDFLKQYRDVSKSGAEKLENLSDSRILSLSYIFLFTIDRNSSCTHRMEPDEHLAVLDDLDIKQHWKPVFDDAVTWCLNLDRQLKTTSSLKANARETKKTAILLWMQDQSDDEQGLQRRVFTDTLLALTDKFDHWMDDCYLESTFISQRITPFLINIFEKDNKLVGKLGECCVSENKDDLSNMETLMADYPVLHRSSSLHGYNLLAVEVKPVGKSSHGQSQLDLVKLGKEMKCMVDRLVDAGMDKTVIGGMLIEGVSCSTFIMDLNYDGVYWMTQLA